MAGNDEPDYTDIVHTGPDTLAGQYLRTFWHPVWRAQDLPPGRAIPLTILSERLTLYRGEGGAPHLVAFRCAHRGTQLSTGWVEDDCLRCRYHGWKYDETGQCVEQPGEDESFAAKVRIRSYPIEEYLGLLFAYLGDGEAPPLRRHPDFEGPGVLGAEAPEYWPCNYFNRVDNACDIGHVAFTHNEAILRTRAKGSQLYTNYSERSWSAEETGYGIRTIVRIPGRPVEHFDFHMPNINQSGSAPNRVGVSGDGAPNAALGRRISWRVPVDDGNTVSFSVDFVAGENLPERHRAGDLAVASSPTEIGDAILAGRLREEDLDESYSRGVLFTIEDYVTQVGQGAIADRANERFGRIDQGVILLRKIWERELRAFAEGRPTKQWGEKPANAIAGL